MAHVKILARIRLVPKSTSKCLLSRKRQISYGFLVSVRGLEHLVIFFCHNVI